MRYLVDEKPWSGKNQYTSSELKQSSNLIAYYLNLLMIEKFRESHI